MKNLIIVLLVLVYSVGVKAQEFRLNSEKSIINWIGKAAFNSYAPKGTLTSKSGVLILEGQTIKKLELIIDMQSLHHDNKELKSHLRNKDFFEVKKYTEALFNLTEPTVLKKDKVILTGDMKIKKSTHSERILVEIKLGRNDLTISYEIRLDRTKYGIKFNSPSFFKKLKENAIADEFKIKGVLVFTKI